MQDKLPTEKLDPTNPDHITYKHPPLDIAVLGGIRLEGLDRMWATFFAIVGKIGAAGRIA